jgi:hypothetical protein
LSELTAFSAFIVICTVILKIYGYFLKIPPFIPITEVSQPSPLLIEHLKDIPSVPLSWIVMLYTVTLCLIFLEFFFSAKYIENINQKLERLLILKYKIDRYQLGISPERNVENVIKQISKLKIHPPSYYTVGGVVSIPIPLSFERCEDLLYSALEDYPEEDKEILDE